MGIVDRVYNVYVSILLEQAPRQNVKGEVVGILSEFENKDLLASKEQTDAWYVAVSMYAFYVEGRDTAWKVLPELVDILKNNKLAKNSDGKFDINAFCFFDENLLGVERGPEYKIEGFKKKGDACLVQGGFFYDNQNRPRARPDPKQLRWTGRNSYRKIAEITHSKDVYDKYDELSRNYEDYEKGFKNLRELVCNTLT